MNFLNGMMNLVSSWKGVADALKNPSGEIDVSFEWIGKILGPISTVMWVLLILVGAAGSIYAIYVGVKMARAESQEQRDENKKRLINIVVSIVVVIVLILFFNTFLPMILDAFGIFNDGKQLGSTATSLVNATKVFLHW